MASLVLVPGVSTVYRDLRVVTHLPPAYSVLLEERRGEYCQESWPHTRVLQFRKVCRMLGEIGRQWTRRLLGVGETGFQAPCGLDYIGVLEYMV